MSFKEKAVSWRQEVHIGKTKPRLIKAAILLLCFGVLIGMAWDYSEFSAKDCAILAGICVLTLAIYMIDMPVHPVIRILFALVIPSTFFFLFFLDISASINTLLDITDVNLSSYNITSIFNSCSNFSLYSKVISALGPKVLFIFFGRPSTKVVILFSSIIFPAHNHTHDQEYYTRSGKYASKPQERSEAYTDRTSQHPV